MKVSTRSIQQILEEQIKKWRVLEGERDEKKEPSLKVITLSRQPGTGGSLIASRVAKALHLKLYHRDINKWVAESAHMDTMTVQALDEKEHSIVESWISAMTYDRHLWPTQYLHHLKKVIGDIVKGDGGVIIGRGANFIVPAENCLRVRVIAPLEDRISNIARVLDVDPKDAKKRILRREAHRKAYIKRYFHQDINDPSHYDIVFNMDHLTLEDAVTMLISAWKSIRASAL